MYETFYGFKKKPFTLTSNAEFLYMGKTHSNAFAMLEYGVLSRSGFTVITGEVGSGKTTLIHHLLKQIDDAVDIGFITNTRKNMGQLLPWVMHAFQLDYREANPVALYDAFSRYLSQQYASGQRTVLIIDEAQNLGPEVLDELRMLSNLNASESRFLQIILVGQPELRALLGSPELMQFAQRIAADYHIAPLTIHETISYIKHRLVTAGANDDVFTPMAYELIHIISRGVPRLINIVCDTALSFAFGDGIRLIEGDYLKGVLKERAEGGLLALGQNPLKQLGASAYTTPDLDEIFARVTVARGNHPIKLRER